MADFRYPNFHQRVAVVGRTGSGKTVFGSHLLSLAAYDRQPFVIIDYKGDELLNAIPHVREIGFGDIPKHPGVYHLKPLPNQTSEMEEWLWKIWKRGKTGLYFDETYQVPDPAKGGAFRAIMTQGRSKRIPAILVTQRPAFISKFIFSEADYFALFHLNVEADKERMSSFGVPNAYDRLPEYHSRWYDVGHDSTFILGPAPSADDILNLFDERLKPRRRRL